MIDFNAGLYNFSHFSVSENGENGLRDKGADGAMLSLRILGLQPPLAMGAIQRDAWRCDIVIN